MRLRLPRNWRIVIEHPKRLGSDTHPASSYPTDLSKEDVSRRMLWAQYKGEPLQFLDVGCGDGDLAYLLGFTENLTFSQQLHDESKARFSQCCVYHGLDLEKGDIQADICAEGLLDQRPDLRSQFDVAYSNNVFEHLLSAWVAARNILGMLKVGGLGIIITPFSLRYHAVPGDYFRFTHTGLASLFTRYNNAETVVSGYDTRGRRNDWQGIGSADDIVPEDELGAWRENWFAVCIFRKIN